MDKIFGSKKKAQPKAQANAPTLSDTSGRLGERIKVLNAKCNESNEELAKIKKQMATSKNPSLKQKALGVLRRKKMYEAQINQLTNQQFNLDTVAFQSESIQDTVNTVNALKTANAAQKAAMKHIDMDNVEDLYDDLADMMEDQKEISEVLGRDFNIDGYNEAELEDELNELDNDIVAEQWDKALNEPSYLPKKKEEAKAASKKEEEELAQMMRI